METKEHFNKRMVARVRRILKETEQYKTELSHTLCEQNGIVIQANNRRVVNTDYLISRIENEDIPFTFMYSANKTYIFGDLRVALIEKFQLQLLCDVSQTSNFRFGRLGFTVRIIKFIFKGH